MARGPVDLFPRASLGSDSDEWDGSETRRGTIAAAGPLRSTLPGYTAP
jgi:hypothetical protein